MKNLKGLLVVALMAVSAPAFAQFANSGSSSSADTEDYNRVGISYENFTLSPDYDDAENTGLNGVGVSYIHGFSVSSTLPIFVETGAKFTAAFKNENGGDYYDEDAEVKTTYLNIAVPVNVAYKFAVGEGMSIQPYLGLNLKFNLVAKQKMSFDEAPEDDESIDFFDKDDVDNTWKRFQLGWHIGAGLNYNQFYVGLSYGTDFIKIHKRVNTGTFSIGVGYNF